MENLRLTPVEYHKTGNLCNTAIVPKKNGDETNVVLNL